MRNGVRLTGSVLIEFTPSDRGHSFRANSHLKQSSVFRMFFAQQKGFNSSLYTALKA